MLINKELDSIYKIRYKMGNKCLKILIHIKYTKMNNQNTNLETLQKRISKERETTEQREACLSRECERKREKRENETDENCDAQLASNHERCYGK